MELETQWWVVPTWLQIPSQKVLRWPRQRVNRCTTNISNINGLEYWLFLQRKNPHKSPYVTLPVGNWTPYSGLLKHMWCAEMHAKINKNKTPIHIQFKKKKWYVTNYSSMKSQCRSPRTSTLCGAFHGCERRLRWSSVGLDLGARPCSVPSPGRGTTTPRNLRHFRAGASVSLRA